MNMQTSDGLHHYVDGQLGHEEAADFEALLESDAELRAEVNAITRQKRLIREAADELDTGPANFRTAALERQLAGALERRARPRRLVVFPQWPLQTAAAAVLLTFGWWGSTLLVPSGSGVPDFVQEAVGAHSVFATDAVRPVEFSAAAVPGVLGWLSEKVGVNVPTPDISPLGIQLVGARLLGTKEGPLLQYIYEDPAGARTSVVLARHPEGDPLQDIQVLDYPGRMVGYWRGADLDYVVVSQAASVDPAMVAGLLSR